MTLLHPAAAWADFWSAPSAGGCLASADAEFEAIEAGVWGPLAAALAPKAQLLDIGTGDGIVLKRLHKLRRSLKLTGIDYSPVLPPAPAGITLKAGIAAESLPFRDATFDAAVSRYGYEYGRTAEVAAETARVVKPAGRLLLIVHHRDSPVLAWNERRSRALRWAAVDSGYIAKARAFASARMLARLPVPPLLSDSVREAVRRFPSDPVAAEVLTAMLQSIDQRLAPAHSQQALAMLERKAGGELARLNALGAAARDEQGIAELATELSAAGFDMAQPSQLANTAGLPLAWLLSGIRRER